MEKLSIKTIKFQEIIKEENIRYSVFREHWACFNGKIFYAKTVWFNRAKETGLNSESCLGCKFGVYLGWRGFWWDFSGLGFLFVSGGLGRGGKSGEGGEFEVSFCLMSPGCKVRGQPVFLQRSATCFFLQSLPGWFHFSATLPANTTRLPLSPFSIFSVLLLLHKSVI